MILYKCDMCGGVRKDLGEMTDVSISHAGTSTVNYPRDGKFLVCKECETKLLNILNAFGAESVEKIIIDAPAPANEDPDRYFLANRCGDSSGNGKDLYKEALREMYLYLHRHNK